MDVTVVRGNIADRSADALVTAAGTNLLMDTGGTGTALLAAGGEALGEAAIEQGPIEYGDVAVTDAYNLDAEYVIHAAAAAFGGEARAEHVRSAARQSLETADDLACRSIVMPAIGCGTAGFEVERGGEIIREEIAQFDPNGLEELELIGYTPSEYKTLERVFDGH